MSRFSKLETGQQGQSQEEDAVKPALKRIRSEQEPAVQYDYGHYVQAGDNLFFRGEFSKAHRQYSRAIQQDAAEVKPWLMQVLCLIEQKQYREAMVWIKRALEMFPESASLLSVEGIAYAQQGMVQRGLSASDYALKKGTSDPMVWLLRAQILALADNRNQQACLDKAMQMREPDDWRIPMQIGLFFMRQKRWSQAADYFKQAANSAINNDYLWLQLGKTYECLGLTQPAYEAYNAAYNVNPANTEAQRCLGRLTNTPVIVRLFRRIFR
jgi:tetratricopeptide (TPR) repeat protein